VKVQKLKTVDHQEFVIRAGVKNGVLGVHLAPVQVVALEESGREPEHAKEIVENVLEPQLIQNSAVEQSVEFSPQ